MLRVLPLAALLWPGIALAGDAPSGTAWPAYVLQLPGTVRNVFIAETDTSTLYRYEPAGGAIERREDRYISVGENGVGKQRAWDGRTPLGIYFANDNLDTSRLHEKYGPKAFPLDYPNAWDDVRERTGDGIWIHGMDARGGRRPPLDTDGCIALDNDDLLDFEQYLQLLITPVIVTRRINTLPVEEIDAVRDSLLTALNSWVSSYRDGDWHTYLGLYADSFSYRGLSRDEWSAYRVRSAATRPVRDFSIDEVLLLADPEEADLYLSRFRQTIVDANGKIMTTKRLYWRRTASGALQIVAEDNG